MSGGKHEEHCRYQFLFGEPLPFFLGSDQTAKQVVAGYSATLRHDSSDVRHEVTCRFIRGGHALWSGDGSQNRLNRLGPGAELWRIARGHADHLADDPTRERVRNGFDDVEIPQPSNRIQQIIGNFLNAGPQRFNPPCYKGLGDERAQSRMFWRVVAIHAARSIVEHRAGTVERPSVLSRKRNSPKSRFL